MRLLRANVRFSNSPHPHRCTESLFGLRGKASVFSTVIYNILIILLLIFPKEAGTMKTASDQHANSKPWSV